MPEASLMCNCLTRPAPPRSAAPPPAPARPLTHAARDRPLFEYVGATALTVIGPASGQRYRFDRPGARLAVDPRDGLALQAVPLLRAAARERRPP
jgi:hypothetical protein